MDPRMPFAPVTRIGTVDVDDAGLGNLDLRAYVAQVLGPGRVAFGAKQATNLVEGQPTNIVSNTGAQKQVAYVAIALPDVDPGPRTVVFSSGPSVGGTDIPATLINNLGVLGGISFAQVLLPGDSLYARPPAGGGNFRVIHSTSWF